MNQHFPIPHQMQGPQDDLYHAKQLIEVISWSLSEAVQNNGMSKDSASVLLAVLCDVQLSMGPVQRFLDKLDYPKMYVDYRKARRDLILDSFDANDDEEGGRSND